MSNQSDINLFTTFSPTFEINGEEKISSSKELPEQKWLHGFEDDLYHQDPMYYPDTGSNVPTLTRQEKYDMLIKDGLTPSEAEAYIKGFRRYPRRGLR